MITKPCALCEKETVEDFHENRLVLCARCVERAEKLERTEWKRRNANADCDSRQCPGWYVMNDDEIERCDTCEQYETDEDAMEHVKAALRDPSA